MRQRAERRVPVNNLDLLPQQDVAQQRNIADHRGEYAFVVKNLDREVVHLEAISHVPDAAPFAVRVCYDNHLVTAEQEALRQVVDVLLDAAHVRIEEVGSNAYSHSAQGNS